MSTLVCLCPIISFISYLSIVGSYHICVVLRVRLHVCFLSTSFCSLYCFFLSLSRSFVPSRDPCYFLGSSQLSACCHFSICVLSSLLSMSLCLWIFVKCVFFRLLSCFLSFPSFCSFIIIWCSIFRSLYLCYVLNSLSLLCYSLLRSCFVSYLSRLFILPSSFTFLLFFSLLLFLTLLISFVPPNSIKLVFC